MMPMFNSRSLLGFGGGLLLALGLAGCNGGGSASDDGGTTPPPATTNTVTGVAMAGPFSSGQVCAYQITGGAQGSQLACANINPADSSFSLSFPDYVGNVLLSVLTGAVYDDEATPGVDATTLTTPLRSLVAVNGGSVSVAITPLTEAACRLANGLDPAAIQAAGQQLAMAYGLTGNGFNLFSTLPRATATNGLQEAYRQALGFMSGLHAASGVSLDAYFAALAQMTPMAYSQQVQNFMNANMPNHCTFGAGAFTCTLPGTGGGGGGGGGVPTGNYNLQVTVTTNLGTPIPAVNILNVPKPSTQAEFCNDEQVLNEIDAINAGNSGATLTITGCSFSGNNGSISARVDITDPIVMSFSYTANYAYSPI